MAPVPQILQLDISIKTLFKITCYLLGLYVFFKAFTIIILVYIALIFASALRPIVTYARYLKIPRPIAILLIYLMILAAIVGIFAIVIPPIVKETDDFIKTIPSWIDTISTKYAWVRDAIREYDIKSFVSSASSALASWTSNLSSGILSNAWTITSGIFGGVISLFLLLVMTFYMIVEENKLTKSIASLFSDDIGKNIAALADTIQAKLGSWFRGQMTLCLIIGVVTYIGYSIIGVKYALPLAVIAGILEIVPYFGPNIAGIIAVLAVLPSSLVLAFMVVI
ncbi:MAG TPA: AI-2E family transporter, partial [bacterium]|nr:AI-2E family transporter [bacterium]